MKEKTSQQELLRHREIEKNDLHRPVYILFGIFAGCVGGAAQSYLSSIGDPMIAGIAGTVVGGAAADRLSDGLASTEYGTTAAAIEA